MEYIILNTNSSNSGKGYEPLINPQCPRQEWNICFEWCPLGGGCGQFFPSIGIHGDTGLEPVPSAKI